MKDSNRENMRSSNKLRKSEMERKRARECGGGAGGRCGGGGKKR